MPQQFQTVVKPADGNGILSQQIKETVLEVFNKLQEDPKNNLLAFAKKYPRDFYAIAAKLLPTEIKADLQRTGKIILEIKWVQRMDPLPVVKRA